MARYNGRDSTPDQEHQPLLDDRHTNGHQDGRAKQIARHKNSGTGKSIWTFLNTNINTNRADVLLIISFFISGMIDAGAYNAYQCFTSMQTGNTVFLALGVSDLPISSPALAWTKSLTSILSFLLGSVVLSGLHRYLGAYKRGTLALSFLVQAVLIAVSAWLVQKGHSSGSPVSGGRSLPVAAVSSSDYDIAALPKDPGFPWLDLVPIALLSFQSAGKVVASRMTSHTGLPVVVLTTLYNDLISDPALFTAGLTANVPRNRKFGGLVMYFCGATAGGAAARSGLGFSGGLAVAGAIQMCVAIGWGIWFEEKDGDRDTT